MIKNKAILAEIEQQKKEANCKNCKNCNVGAFNSGKWYCKKISIFESNINIDECFERK